MHLGNSQKEFYCIPFHNIASPSAKIDQQLEMP